MPLRDGHIQAVERAKSLGEHPVRRVNAVLNALADW